MSTTSLAKEIFLKSDLQLCFLIFLLAYLYISTLPIYFKLTYTFLVYLHISSLPRYFWFIYIFLAYLNISSLPISHLCPLLVLPSYKTKNLHIFNSSTPESNLYTCIIFPLSIFSEKEKYDELSHLILHLPTCTSLNCSPYLANRSSALPLAMLSPHTCISIPASLSIP